MERKIILKMEPNQLIPRGYDSGETFIEQQEEKVSFTRKITVVTKITGTKTESRFELISGC